MKMPALTRKSIADVTRRRGREPSPKFTLANTST